MVKYEKPVTLNQFQKCEMIILCVRYIKSKKPPVPGSRVFLLSPRGHILSSPPSNGPFSLSTSSDLIFRCHDFLVAHILRLKLLISTINNYQNCKKGCVTIFCTGIKGVIWTLQVLVVLYKIQVWRTVKALCAQTHFQE